MLPLLVNSLIAVTKKNTPKQNKQKDKLDTYLHLFSYFSTAIIVFALIQK